MSWSQNHDKLGYTIPLMA